MIGASVSNPVYRQTLRNYFQYLVDHFFKILPMKEQQDSGLPIYLSSLKFEILGFEGLFVQTDYNASVITLLSILQSMIDDEQIDVSVVRREVFHAISICNKLKDLYSK